TVMSSMPAFLNLLRRTLAPIADDPIPASQANTTFWIGVVATAVAVAVAVVAPVAAREARLESASDDLPLLASVCAIAAASGSPAASAAMSRLREASRIGAETGNVTAAERSTDRMTPLWPPGAVWMSTAQIDPGAAGATRPDWKIMFVSTRVAPPAMRPTISSGLASTYGKYTSWMPPRNWMMNAPGAVARATPTPNTVRAS